MIKRLTCVSDIGSLKINNCCFYNGYGDGYTYIEIITGEEAISSFWGNNRDNYKELCSFHLKEKDKIEIYKYDCRDEVIFEINGISDQWNHYYLFIEKEAENRACEFKLVKYVL
jgi:hypothetical protein